MAHPMYILFRSLMYAKTLWTISIFYADTVISFYQVVRMRVEILPIIPFDNSGWVVRCHFVLISLYIGILTNLCSQFCYPHMPKGIELAFHRLLHFFTIDIGLFTELVHKVNTGNNFSDFAISYKLWFKDDFRASVPLKCPPIRQICVSVTYTEKIWQHISSVWCNLFASDSQMVKARS